MNSRPDDSKRNEKILRTSAILAFVTTLPQLLRLFFGSKIPNALSACSAALTVYYLHHVGERRRRGSNMVAKTTAFIQSGINNPLDADQTRAKNAIRNIINGGGSVFDRMVETVNEQVEANDQERPRNEDNNGVISDIVTAANEAYRSIKDSDTVNSLRRRR